MKSFTKEQIETVVEWMKTWEQLADTSIPLRFVEDFANKFKSETASDCLVVPSLGERLDFAAELAQRIDKDMPVCAILAATYWMQDEMLKLNK